MKSIRIGCVYCPAQLVIGGDDPAPQEWVCPTCEDRIEEQQRAAWLEREEARRRHGLHLVAEVTR